jgi:hypothetical protein
MNRPVHHLCVWLALLLVTEGLSGAEGSPSRAEQLFARKVQPLLREKCLACHGDDAKKIAGGLDLRSLDGLRKGGESKVPALVAGKSAMSPLYLAVTRESDVWTPMPPKENDSLTGEQVGYLKEWIDAGAPWPDDRRIGEILKSADDPWTSKDGVAVKTSGGLSPEWTNRKYTPENLWAYQPLKGIAPGDLAKGVHPIDAILGTALQKKGLRPAGRADRRTLIRRATFDLLGLPPTPDEVESFVSDPATDEVAFAKVVERLLASPHYGEQWARHWLDVARYADSSGYANDYERGNAWRYRDYVIRVFNEDRPYDQFVREQVAGDEIDPDNPEMLIAVGFLRMGPWELTGMEVAKVARQRFLDDVTDAVGQVFLGHMLQCARCHDHKFDPVPTRDYYGVQAIFATTQLAERPAAFLPSENTLGFEEKKYLEKRRGYYQELLNRLDEKAIAAARAWYAEKKLDPAPLEEALGKADSRRGRLGYQAARGILQRKGIPEEQIPPRHVGFSPEDYGIERIARKGLERLKWVAERYEPVALSVYSGRTPSLRSVNAPLRMPADRMTSGELEQTCILAGGDPFSPRAQVAPGMLSAANSLGRAQGFKGDVPSSVAGRRTALANWIASRDNPLTARVMVNRIWQWHFGRALAGNPNNFGATGKQPTHPELLDWLAAEFINRGWSVKAMHRLIMSSQAYQRSSRHPEADALAEKDPHGTSYAAFSPRRLDAEEMRDAVLRVTGELNPELGGIPVRPEINLEAALQPRQVMGTFAEAWQPSPLPKQRHRR